MCARVAAAKKMRKRQGVKKTSCPDVFSTINFIDSRVKIWWLNGNSGRDAPENATAEIQIVKYFFLLIFNQIPSYANVPQYFFFFRPMVYHFVLLCCFSSDFYFWSIFYSYDIKKRIFLSSLRDPLQIYSRMGLWLRLKMSKYCFTFRLICIKISRVNRVCFCTCECV